MPEPLKNMYNVAFVQSMGQQISTLHSGFDIESFVAHVMDSEWQDKELKQRMQHIAQSLHQYLPKDYALAIKILMQLPVSSNGFEYMCLPAFVALYGLHEFELSIQALAHFTKQSSSEFAVRPFIIKYPRKMMAQMMEWAESENHHVRRLASEGCRPRLPWAMALPAFKQDPSAIMPILTRLKNDDSGYVRRSVANNLNDISKDHPQVVIAMAQQWLGDNPHTDWLVKHACRTLLKQGQLDVMRLFGFENPKHIQISHFAVQQAVKLGAKLDFSFTLETQKKQLGKIRIEYAIDFVKNNGKLARKLFAISESEVRSNNKTITKSHSFRKISTRKYYVGQHVMTIIVNGFEFASMEFLVDQ